MIRASIDLNREYLNEFLDSLPDIRNSLFDGVEICLWENMLPYAKTIKGYLEKNNLSPTVHNNLMRNERSLMENRDILSSSLHFSAMVRSKRFITHPIKPYSDTVFSSKELFEEFPNICVETVKDIRLPQTKIFGKPLVLDIGSIIQNGELHNLSKYQNVREIHIHDTIKGVDHNVLGTGEVDVTKILKQFDMDYTIELGHTFRKWNELREGYRNSIDFFNNAIIKKDSYGKNIRLQHLNRLCDGKYFPKITELGCREGYLLYNTAGKTKIGIDLEVHKKFNCIDYKTADIERYIEPNTDLVICSEVVEHLENDRQAIRNMYQSLNHKGNIFLTTINANTGQDKSAQDKLHGHRRRYDSNLKSLMESEGFKTLNFYPIRSAHYYTNKGDVSKYDASEDIRQGSSNASGWIYFGVKE